MTLFHVEKCFLFYESWKLLSPSATCDMSVFPFLDAAVAVYADLHMDAFVRQGGMRWLLNWMNLWLRI